MSRASALYRLQQIDLLIDQARARLAEVDAALADHGNLERSQESAREAETRARQADQVLRSAEDAVGSEREKLGQVDAKLYGGSVHNPKELQELQAEAESLRRHLGALEDRVLEAMQASEDAEAAAESARTGLELAQADSSGREASLATQRGALMATLERHDEEREAAVVGVSPDDLRIYASLRKGPGSLAVAEFVDDTCSACGVTMTASARQGIRSGPDLVRCRQCGRILYAS